MIKVLLTGCGGRMGKAVTQLCESLTDVEICAGVDPTLPECDYPVYSSCDAVKEQVNVIIDFSFHAAIEGILNFAISKKIPAVIATTGFTPQELQLLEEAKKVFDYVIVDTPPLGSVIDAAVIAKTCDASILALTSDKCSRGFVKSVITQLRNANPNFLGVVLNKVDMAKNSYYGKKYGGYYGKKYNAYASYYGNEE